MSENQLPLSEASADQLRTFALSYLGMTFPGNTQAETMRAKIGYAWSKDHILLADPVDEGVQVPPKLAEQEGPKDKVRVIIQRTEDAGGDEPVPLSVNGRAMLVPRGEPVDIPREYFEVLEHAVTHRYEALRDGGISSVPREIPLYPHQVVHA